MTRCAAGIAMVASLSLYAWGSALTAADMPQPNIVFIFIDDMGYGDIGPFGNTVNRTPHLDRMAEEGLVLRQFYVSNTACTPSRSALLTGTYAARIGMDGRVCFPGENRGLNPSEITIADLLKAKGYVTGCFGKWHLGDQPEFLPLKQGFDEYFGIPYSNDMWPGNLRGNPLTKGGPYTPLPVVRQDRAIAYVSDPADQSLLCEAVTDEAVTFIRKHRDKPFFLYLPHAYVHNPRYARPEILAKADGDVRRANVEEVDTSVGRVLDTLRELKIEQKTLVIFTSDNGGAGGSMGPLRGNKGGPKYEGHMREPTVVWWPGTIPAGESSDEIATTTDILPSLARLVGADVPTDRVIDGKDALDVLLGKPGATSPHEILYYEAEGIRRGKWKLVKVRNKLELYDLEADIGEKNDFAKKHPDVTKELAALLEKHAADLEKNVRPPAFVENAKPIISEPGDLPRLRELMGLGDMKIDSFVPIPPPKGKPVAAQPAPAKVASYMPEPDEILVADFEGDSYGDWEVEGEALGKGPAVANAPPLRNRVTGHQGKKLVNTYLGGDGPTGTLTSPEFTIERKYLCFLIGGGAHRGKTCMDLLIGGKAMRTAAGSATKDQNREVMRWVSWDVAEFAGKKATLRIVDAHTGGWGHINIDHIVQRNSPLSGGDATAQQEAAPAPAGKGPMPSREIKLTGRYLLVPVRPRKDPEASTPNRGNNLTVRVGGQLVHSVGVILAAKPEQVEFWGYLDVNEYVGKMATLTVSGPYLGNALALLECSDSQRYLKPLYSEQGRPQFHFSQKQGWNNDVNGMVYHDGLYHLSWQCNPVGRSWGNMYWGHAVSRDLVHWEEWPRILRCGGGRGEDGKVTAGVHPSMAVRQCFSGSACVDTNNMLGKQEGDTKTLIACFTDTGSGLPGGPGEALAYSTDGGRTYTYLRDLNPIISHKGRDPRLFWHSPTNSWCIVTYEAGKKVDGKGIVGGKMAFYSSPDLETWTFNSFSDAVYHECPEFVELPVDPPPHGGFGATGGDPANKRWLLFDATPKYQIGSFDGKAFKSEFTGTRQTMGGSIKAAQCFSNAPDGRAIWMIWARARYGDDAPFAQGFSLPAELTLRTAVDGPRLYANPVKELEALRQTTLLNVAGKALPTDGATFPLPQPEPLVEIQATVTFEGTPTAFRMGIADNGIHYDFAKKEFPSHRLKVFDKDDGRFDVRVFVDRATVEVFAENGAVYYLEGRGELGKPVEKLTIQIDGKATLESLNVYKLKSIWE